MSTLSSDVTVAISLLRNLHRVLRTERATGYDFSTSFFDAIEVRRLVEVVLEGITRQVEGRNQRATLLVSRQNLPAIAFSGVFTRRSGSTNFVIRHTYDLHELDQIRLLYGVNPHLLSPETELFLSQDYLKKALLALNDDLAEREEQEELALYVNNLRTSTYQFTNGVLALLYDRTLYCALVKRDLLHAFDSEYSVDRVRKGQHLAYHDLIRRTLQCLAQLHDASESLEAYPIRSSATLLEYLQQKDDEFVEYNRLQSALDPTKGLPVGVFHLISTAALSNPSVLRAVTGFNPP
ncbi:hypothetical protein GMRT_10572 [Giardia muris]|uniref:Uncharacterized protein n=1 Tax=Giardia muris TaxID=5742 RepID=A0A4Z1T2P8_GIAMU|nr:hypothetical protein GMRT_10572 [Giardia muris]|eukprot:TNJ26849.1 hypothetical protein GMRT_10572 [Giardia muris]